MSTEIPKTQNWLDLALVARNVELIVADVPQTEKTHPGLLGFFPKEPVLPLNAGKLYKDLHHGTLLSRAGDTGRIVEILPGSDLLGANREERLSKLTARLVELPAYKWLQVHGYEQAVRTLHRKATSSQAGTLRPGYARDTREFLLLGAIVWPIHEYLLYSELGIQPPFPTKQELDRAAEMATSLLDFLRKFYPVKEVVEIPNRFERDLDLLATALTEVAPVYVKPRVDSTYNERRFVDAVIRNCGHAFGDCSNRLIRSLLEVIDFEYDEASLKRKIASWRTANITPVVGGS